MAPGLSLPASLAKISFRVGHGYTAVVSRTGTTPSSQGSEGLLIEKQTATRDYSVRLLRTPPRHRKELGHWHRNFRCGHHSFSSGHWLFRCRVRSCRRHRSGSRTGTTPSEPCEEGPLIEKQSQLYILLAVLKWHKSIQKWKW